MTELPEEMVVEIRKKHYRDAKFHAIHDDPLTRAFKEQLRFKGTTVSAIPTFTVAIPGQHTVYDLVPEYTPDQFTTDTKLLSALKVEDVVRRVKLIKT